MKKFHIVREQISKIEIEFEIIAETEEEASYIAYNFDEKGGDRENDTIKIVGGIDDVGFGIIKCEEIEL